MVEEDIVDDETTVVEVDANGQKPKREDRLGREIEETKE